MLHRNLLFLLLLVACQSPTPPAGDGANSAAGNRFKFSEAAPEAGLRDALNWCMHSFHEAIRLDAAPGNANRRVFALGTGAHRIVVEAGNQTASFILKKNSATAVEVYTSANFPICLSDRNNFRLDTSNGSLHYDNGKGIQFTVEAVEHTNGRAVTLEIPVDAGYGFLVHRCDDCE